MKYEKKIPKRIKVNKKNKELQMMIREAKKKGYKVRNVGIDDYGKFYLVIS